MAIPKILRSVLFSFILVCPFAIRAESEHAGASKVHGPLSNPNQLPIAKVQEFFGTSVENAKTVSTLLNLDGREELLTQPAALTVAMFEHLYCTWPAEERASFLALGDDRAAKMKFLSERYNFVYWPENQNRPVGVSFDNYGGMHVNCLMCHMSRCSDDQLRVGAPHTPNISRLLNDLADLQDINQALREGKTGRRADLPKDCAAPLFKEYSSQTRNLTKVFAYQGTTNAFNYSEFLAKLRDPKDMEVKKGYWWQNAWSNSKAFKEFVDHRTGDYPIPWWSSAYKKKKGVPLYHTGAVGAYALNGDEHNKDNFTAIHTTFFTPGNSWAELEKHKDVMLAIDKLVEDTPMPPKPKLDATLVDKGKTIYLQKGCQKCHGTYGATPDDDVPPNATYNMGTDVQLSRTVNGFIEQITPSKKFRASAFKAHPEGAYQAPPLRGLSCKGSLMHNGSVPGLDAMLRNGAGRPKHFELTGKRTPFGNEFKVATPETPGKEKKYTVYNTTVKGFSNRGHLMPNFTEAEREALMNYLSSL
jgi:mono/diheme cytochrome c family protein